MYVFVFSVFIELLFTTRLGIMAATSGRHLPKHRKIAKPT
jgi:hypothetical protein